MGLRGTERCGAARVPCDRFCAAVIFVHPHKRAIPGAAAGSGGRFSLPPRLRRSRRRCLAADHAAGLAAGGSAVGSTDTLAALHIFLHRHAARKRYARSTAGPSRSPPRRSTVLQAAAMRSSCNTACAPRHGSRQNSTHPCSARSCMTCSNTLYERRRRTAASQP